MEAYCDLHTHSYYSDGSFSPAQVLKAAEQAGLAAVALCDHNSVAGLPEFVAAGESSPVEAVPGIEFSTDYQGTELHILALFILPEHYGTVNGLLEEGQRKKAQSNELLVQALNRAGISLDLEKIRAGTRDGYVNRAHIATEMTRLGYTESVQEAFKTWLSPDRGFYTPPRWTDACAAIHFIKSIGAAAVLAHPFLSLDEARLQAFLPEAVAVGLDAMEVLYPKYDGKTTSLAERIAEEYGLLPSGGSDFHGEAKPDIRIGTGRGELRVPVDWLEHLKERRSDPKKVKKQ